MTKKQIINFLAIAQIVLAIMAIWGYTSEDRAFAFQAIWAMGYVAVAIIGVAIFKQADRPLPMAVRR